MNERTDNAFCTTYKLDDAVCTTYKVNGELHRANGYAMKWQGDWGWCLFNVWHRYYGPARKYGAWYSHGRLVK